jgi:glycosyltransferase involved in cell wall biosynthesis
MPWIREALPGARLLVVGEGPLRACLEAQAARLSLAGVVAFAGYRPDVETAYAAMDLLVFPSRARYESQGIALVEAMAMGVPVVGTQVSGVVDVVEDGRTGLLVPPEDPAALAAAVRRLRSNESLRRALVRRAGAAVAARFSREAMAARTEALYRDLLD